MVDDLECASGFADEACQVLLGPPSLPELIADS